jgi:hypothetical protein
MSGQKVDVKRLFELWHTDMSNQMLCKALGIRRTLMYSLKDRYGLPKRFVSRASVDDDPTPAEIEAKCAEIRSRWTPQEEAQRLVGGGRKQWRPPSYSSFDRETMSFRA